VDTGGIPLPPDKSYHVYNAFIDFHGFCNIFAERTEGGKGVQDLKSIGQKIVHEAAFTEAPVNLGSSIAEGSTFKNGEVTLELKGLSRVAGAACAMVGFDSGESSFKMTVKPMPDMEVRTVGSSHYKGDIYIDLSTNWVRKVTMDELVVAEVDFAHAAGKGKRRYRAEYRHSKCHGGRICPPVNCFGVNTRGSVQKDPGQSFVWCRKSG